MDLNGFVTYKLNQVTLEPDQYGRHLRIKMVTMYVSQGKYVKHVKLDEDILEILAEGVVIPNQLAAERLMAHSTHADESSAATSDCPPLGRGPKSQSQ